MAIQKASKFCISNSAAATAATAATAVTAHHRVVQAQETEDLELDVPTVRDGVASLLSDASKGRYYVLEVDGTVVAQLMITLEWSDWRNMQAGLRLPCSTTLASSNASCWMAV